MEASDSNFIKTANEDGVAGKPNPNNMTIEVSDQLLNEKGMSEARVKLDIALLLFQRELYSLGKASEFAGLHSAQFQKELTMRQIPIHYDVDEYLQDLDTLDNDKDPSPTYHRI